MATSDALRRGREADEQATRCAEAAKRLWGGDGMEGALKRALEVEVELLLRFAHDVGYRRTPMEVMVASLEKAMAPGGCGQPGHVTERADEGTCHCATCEREAETEAMRLEALDAAPARQEGVYNGD